MTKEEARKLLEGTWSFTASGNNVLVREVSLLQEIDRLTQAARPASATRTRHSVIAQPLPAFAATG